jgi:hypothetical protein
VELRELLRGVQVMLVWIPDLISLYLVLMFFLCDFFGRGLIVASAVTGTATGATSGVSGVTSGIGGVVGGVVILAGLAMGALLV